MSILPKKICNMHIACHNMHIAIESILPLTHARTGGTADDGASGLLEEQPIVHFATYYLIDHTFLRMMTSSREYINSGAPPPR